MPQVREGGFYPSALEKGMRSERALVATLAEMYVQGVSTRKVKAITEELCGVEMSAIQVSRATAQLDKTLQEWRERPLGEITYLYLDARYEKVREAGQVRDTAVLVATGITPEGIRQVLNTNDMALCLLPLTLTLPMENWLAVQPARHAPKRIIWSISNVVWIQTRRSVNGTLSTIISTRTCLHHWCAMLQKYQTSLLIWA